MARIPSEIAQMISVNTADSIATYRTLRHTCDCEPLKLINRSFRKSEAPLATACIDCSVLRIFGSDVAYVVLCSVLHQHLIYKFVWQYSFIVMYTSFN